MEKFPAEKPENEREEEKIEKSKKREKSVIEASRISVPFEDPKILEKIADELHSQGLISGFNLRPIEAGYFFHGKRVTENQYVLEILIDPDLADFKKEAIKKAVQEKIGSQWETPAVIEDKVSVNKELLGFIKQAETEHRRYRKERKLRVAAMTAFLLSVMGITGVFLKKYQEEKIEKAVKQEQKETLKKINTLQETIQKQIAELDSQIEKGELHTLPTDMAADVSYEETNRILKTVRELESSLENLAQSEKGK